MTQHGLVRSPSGPTWACHAYTTTKGSSGSPPNAFRPIEELAADEEENDPTLYYESAKEPDFNRHTASTGTSGLSVSRGSGSSIGSSHKRSSAASASSWLLHMMPFPEERDAHFALYPSLNASQAPFSADIAKILASPVNPKEIQIKPGRLHTCHVSDPWLMSFLLQMVLFICQKSSIAKSCSRLLEQEASATWPSCKHVDRVSFHWT